MHVFVGFGLLKHFFLELRPEALVGKVGLEGARHSYETLFEPIVCSGDWIAYLGLFLFHYFWLLFLGHLWLLFVLFKSNLIVNPQDLSRLRDFLWSLDCNISLDRLILLA